jgi:hypothetical protein
MFPPSGTWDTVGICVEIYWDDATDVPVVDVPVVDRADYGNSASRTVKFQIPY